MVPPSLAACCGPLVPPTALAGCRAIGCSGNGELPALTTKHPGVPFTGAARERTSAGVFRAGLPVSGPASLAASARVLFSVAACALFAYG